MRKMHLMICLRPQRLNKMISRSKFIQSKIDVLLTYLNKDKSHEEAASFPYDLLCLTDTVNDVRPILSDNKQEVHFHDFVKTPNVIESCTKLRV